MTLILLIHVILIIISYLLFKFTKYDKLWRSNIFLLAITGVFLILIMAFQLVISWYSGYLNEEFAFYFRAFGNKYYLICLFSIVSVGLCILNFSKKYRKKKKLQFIIVALFIAIIALDWSSFIERTNMTSFVVPGWHTNIYDLKVISLIYFILLILLNFIIIRFRLIPEMKNDDRESVSE